MDTLQCSFCSHENPADAKFCNACGSSLNLQLCAHCGAVDHVSSRNCYKCGAPFAAVEPSPAPPAPAASELLRQSDPDDASRNTALESVPVRRGPAWLRVGAILLVAVGAAFVYRAYRPDGALLSAPGLVRTVPAPGDVDAVSGEASERKAAVPVPVPVAAPTPQPAEAPAEVAPPETPAQRQAEGGPAPPYPCTAAVVALGLCD